MFRSNTSKNGQPRILTIKLPPTGEETVDVRFPTDEEWCKRTSSLRMVQRQIGVGKSKTEGLNGVEVNADLFDKIVLDRNHSLSKPTASWVIDQLERTDVLEVARQQGVFIVKLGVRGGVVCHFVDGNKLKQDRIVEFNRRSVDVYRNGNVIESRSYLEPAGTLYNDCTVSNQPPEGYAGDVPIIHKAVVMEAVLAEIDRTLSDYQDDEDDDDDDDPDDNGVKRRREDEEEKPVGEPSVSGRPSLTGSDNTIPMARAFGTRS